MLRRMLKIALIALPVLLVAWAIGPFVPDIACRFASGEPGLLWALAKPLARIGAPAPTALELALRKDGGDLVVDERLWLVNPRPHCPFAEGDVVVPLPQGARDLQAEGATLRDGAAVLSKVRVEGWNIEPFVIRYRLPLPSLPGEVAFPVPWLLAPDFPRVVLGQLPPADGGRMSIYTANPWAAGVELVSASMGDVAFARAVPPNIEFTAKDGQRGLTRDPSWTVMLAPKQQVLPGTLRVALGKPADPIAAPWTRDDDKRAFDIEWVWIGPRPNPAWPGYAVNMGVAVVNKSDTPIREVEIPLLYDPSFSGIDQAMPYEARVTEYLGRWGGQGGWETSKRKLPIRLAGNGNPVAVFDLASDPLLPGETRVMPYFAYISPLNCRSKNPNICYLPRDFYWPGKAWRAFLADAEQGVQLAIHGVDYGNGFIRRPPIHGARLVGIEEGWKEYELPAPVDEIRGSFWNYKREPKLPPPYPPLPFDKKKFEEAIKEMMQEYSGQ